MRRVITIKPIVKTDTVKVAPHKKLRDDGEPAMRVMSADDMGAGYTYRHYKSAKVALRALKKLLKSRGIPAPTGTVKEYYKSDVCQAVIFNAYRAYIIAKW